MSNSSKGAHKLASVLQKRTKSIYGRETSVSAEMGLILSGGRLRIDSIPDAVIDESDYSVCQTISGTEKLKSGDRVLVIWSFDGEPVVIDKIIQADKA